MTGQRLEGAVCRHCGHDEILVEWRLVADPIGSKALAGHQLKTTATSWPYAVCQGCGHTSKGTPE